MTGTCRLALITVLCCVIPVLAGGFGPTASQVSHHIDARHKSICEPNDTKVGSVHFAEAGPVGVGKNIAARLIAATDERERKEKDGSARLSVKKESSGSEPVWKSHELNLLAIGLGVGDVTGDGKNNVVVSGPSAVELYDMVDGRLNKLDSYEVSPMEIKSLDVAKIRKHGPARIYVSAQNRAGISSFVLEYRNGKLTPVVTNFQYYLRVIIYPTQGPILLGQRKSLSEAYDGPIFRLADRGDSLQVTGRFGVPLKIPIFGFTVGDFVGNRKPLIAVYDREDHLRVYKPDGKRLFVSPDYYGGSDIPLRVRGMEERRDWARAQMVEEKEFYRPRIMSWNVDGSGVYQVIIISHSSKTGRMLTRTKMLEDGRIMGLRWNGETLVAEWSTPSIQGMVADFTIGALPGLAGERLITLERKKTDWLSFLSSKSMVKAYDLDSLTQGELGKRDLSK